MAQNNITTQQRMLNFSTLTRQNRHEIAPKVTDTEFSSLQFEYPKARLLAQTHINVEVSFKLKHASLTSLELNVYDPYKIIRKITQDLNNGFMPVVMSGTELAMYNTIATHPEKIITTGGMKPVKKLTASTSGAENKMEFCLEVKNTLNDSMLQGLILLQNNSTMVNLNVDIGSMTDVLKGHSGFTAENLQVKITPMITTYTIPSNPDAFPDISVLKLMQAKTTTFTSGGDNLVYFDTGTIYRKIALYMTDADGNPLKPEDINGKMELAFNTADIPYSISAKSLRMLNADEFGVMLPEGLFVFDFSSQSPLIGYGGSRDYIDTEKLTSFTLKVNTANAIRVTSITEQLSRLI